VRLPIPRLSQTSIRRADLSPWFWTTGWRMTQSDANQSLSELAQLMIFTATWLTLWGG